MAVTITDEEGPISTHAPAGGATRHGHNQGRPAPNFYSRPCGRGDTEAIIKIAETLTISTHAPAGGATAILPDCRIRF